MKYLPLILVLLFPTVAIADADEPFQKPVMTEQTYINGAICIKRKWYKISPEVIATGNEGMFNILMESSRYNEEPCHPNDPVVDLEFLNKNMNRL